VLERIAKGDMLVVVRIDRLARSLSHLLEVIERLEAKGAFFRSLTDPIDTSSPQGKFTLQVLGAAAEFERPDPRTHQGGAGLGTQQGADRRQPGFARPRSRGASQGAAGATGR
jgi:DNA invertase Pin-like site-specific DNA recombinase